MTHHILIFDSGVGGLSVVEEIVKQNASFRFSYFVDDASFPFGDKTADFLIDRSQKLFKKVITQSSPDLIIVACNTASTLILPSLRTSTSIPVIGVVPAIKPAALISQTGRIGLLATQATLANNYIDELKRHHAKDCELIKIDAQALVEISEKYYLKKTAVDDEIKNWIQSLTDFNTDVNVLGCTHFPLIRPLLEQYWPKTVTWIDSGEAIAKRAQHLLSSIAGKEHTQLGFFYTKNQFNALLFEQLKTIGIHSCKQIKVE